MQILLKLTIPDKVLDELNMAARKLSWKKTWWDVLYQSFEQVAKRYEGKLTFVKVRQDKGDEGWKFWRRKE